MGSLDSIHFSEMLDKKRRLSRDSSILHLITAVILVSMIIYLWHFTGCYWTSKSFLCLGSSSEYVLVLPNNSSATAVLQKNDFTKLIDLNNFAFLINDQSVCNDSDPILLVLVVSHPNNFLKRSTIRSTWGSIVSSRFKLLFLVGISGNKRLQTSLEKESRVNGDLIQGNFFDAYRNMTYKHVMALKWVTYFCPNSKYVLKADDDVFVNSPAMLDYISKSLLPFSVNKLLFCSLIVNGRAKRSSRSKWKVTFPEYRFPMYPTYCEGFAILYSPDVVFTLYAEAQSANYFWIDDVHITGLLAAKANIRHSSFGDLFLPRERFSKFLRDEIRNSSYLIGPFNLREEDIIKLWEKVFYSATVEDNETADKS